MQTFGIYSQHKAIISSGQNNGHYFPSGFETQKIQRIHSLPLGVFQQKTYCAIVWDWLALME